MAIEIVQLAQYPFRALPSSYGDISFDTSMKWRQGVDKLTHVPGVLTHSANGEPLADHLNWKIKGNLVCDTDKYSGCESMWKEFQQLASLAGGQFHMIGVRDADLCSNCGNATTLPHCRNCGTQQYSQWMTICVELVDMKRVFEWKNGNTIPYDNLGIEITVSPSQPYWEPLDDIRWKYWARNRPDFTFIGGQDSNNPIKFRHPDRVPRPIPSGGGFQWLDIPLTGQLHMMQIPANWLTAYQNFNSTQDKHQRGAFSSAATGGPTEMLVYTYPEFWSAPPRSLYHFGGLADVGSITINIKAALTSQVIRENSASLDLAVLDANLASDGFTGIQAGDYMIVGETMQGGGIYIRNNAVLDTYIPWAYTGQYPGYTYPGWNQVSVQGDFEDFTIAHIFRSH